MSDVSLIEAWSIWLSGDLPDSTLLWGISILWWERIGKIMQVLGATTIIADIIGPEEIRKFGSSLQGRLPTDTLIQYLKQCFNWYAFIFRQTVLKDYLGNASEVKPEKGHSRLNLLNYLVCLLLTGLIVHTAELYAANWGALLVEFAIIYGCLVVSIAPLFTVLAIIGLTTLGLATNSLIIKPIAWFLEHPSLDRFTKIISLLLLLVGFHFELLAS
ncbi:hypothetical protein C7271_14950 [filamentous cyanobacterium CCP5]|nr:hypothetical protein C7271_14950 [filamentous cyanobacterium CCP5]